MKENKKCDKIVRENGVTKYRQCKRKAVMTAEDGKCYCKLHSPEGIAKRLDKNCTKAIEKLNKKKEQTYYGIVGKQALEVLKSVEEDLENSLVPREEIINNIKKAIKNLTFKL